MYLFDRKVLWLVAMTLWVTVQATEDSKGSISYSNTQTAKTSRESVIDDDSFKEDSNGKPDVGAIPKECRGNTFEIKSPADLRKIEHCKVISGDIVITDYKYPIITLDELEHVEGSLFIRRSPELVRVEAGNLQSISNAFAMSELTSLSLVSLPSLRSVKTLQWNVLPILSTVQFSKEIHDIESITVSDTSLTGFTGFMAKKLETLDINNNRFLDEIVSGVVEITGMLHIAANSADVKVDFPSLRSANNVSIHEVAEISLNQLETVTHTASLINNRFSSLKLPKLKSVGGTLNLLKNDNLRTIEVPTMTEIGGGLMIVNNTKVDKIDFLPKLITIGGAIEMVGPIKETTLKSLKLVKGSAKIKSSAASFDCSKWSRSQLSSVVRGGKIECTNANNERVVSNTPTDGGVKDSSGFSTETATSGLFKYGSGGSSIELPWKFAAMGVAAVLFA